MRVLAVLLVAAATAAAVATAVLILRLPDPPGPDDPENFGLEVQTGTFTEQNAARRNDYLLAGGIVSLTLLGGALVLAVASGRGRHPKS